MSERSPSTVSRELMTLGRARCRVSALFLALGAAVMAGSCGDADPVLEPQPLEPADVRAVSLDLLPGNLLVGNTASVRVEIANVGGSPSGPMSWEIRVGESTVAAGELPGIEADHTELITHSDLGPFEVGSHTLVLEVQPAARDVGDGDGLVQQRSFNVFEPGYRIDLRIIGELTQNQEAAFQAARERWERVIVGGLEPTRVTLEANECWEHPAAFHPAVDEVVDDVLIIAIVADFGNPQTQAEPFLALAGPCVLREENLLAATGLMVFNIYAVQHFEGVGRLEDMVAHEIGHILGINPEVWESRELLVGRGGPDPRFVGSHAQRAYREITAHPLSGAVPVENEGGPATRDAHWRWRDFTNPRSSELMTAIFRDENPLSALTIGALEDIGYAVEVGWAESYALSATAAPGRAGPVLEIGDDRLPGRLRVVSPDGRTRMVLDRQ